MCRSPNTLLLFLFPAKASEFSQMPPPQTLLSAVLLYQLPSCILLHGVAFPYREDMSVYFLSLSPFKTVNSGKGEMYFIHLISGAEHSAWDMVDGSSWMITKDMHIWMRACTQTERLQRHSCVTWSLEKVYHLFVVVIISNISFCEMNYSGCYSLQKCLVFHKEKYFVGILLCI